MSEMNNDEWQAPPPPESMKIVESNVPQMSEAGSLLNIFIEPGRTFEFLRAKPKFILATVIIAILTTTFLFTFQQKMGEDRYRRFVEEQIEKSPQAANLDAAQKRSSVDLQLKIGKYVVYAVPIFILIAFLIGGLIYWLGGNAMGGEMTFMRGLSVWVYSSFPIVVVTSLANLVVLFLKSTDEIDISQSQRGLLDANLGFLIDGKAMPVLKTVLATFDVFQIWGWILAAIGLKIVGKLSGGSAWAVVIILALVGVAFRVIGAFFSGNPN